MRQVDSGCYQILIHLPAGVEVTVGRLGVFWFEPGWYVYTGSARRGLSHRLRRHATHDKPLRWHIDYLTTVAGVAGQRVYALDASRPALECELHRELAAVPGVSEPVRGFGSSDCRCHSHLCRLPEALVRSRFRRSDDTSRPTAS